MSRRFLNDHLDALLDENLNARWGYRHPALILSPLSGNTEHNTHGLLRFDQPPFKGLCSKIKLYIPYIRRVSHRQFHG